MKRIGLISDTHSVIPESVLKFMEDVDEIWHAGDIGSIEVVHKLPGNKKFRAVYGNIDGSEIRSSFNEIEVFECEGITVLLMHIGGYPGKYSKQAKEIFDSTKIDLFISGHSHILKVMYDKKLDMMHINPGAAGMSGFHEKQTAVKFVVDDQQIKDLQIFNLNR